MPVPLTRKKLVQQGLEQVAQASRARAVLPLETAVVVAVVHSAVVLVAGVLLVAVVLFAQTPWVWQRCHWTFLIR